ncbi:tetratricopeptide repeat protein [Lentzea flava]|uniref:Tetratricopeptide repeat-containing protein n=1 Tax=Lentzea flava TaxID=103732 RepID=A0ABQ2V9R7_9PSEU|nr:tetratricopeptide repeat protein [Lentzea flava]MCP2204176.1 Tetratricopeptide repeat-containing protein [Lentzea flava]GGU75341.1 hypothetical protein GCM10010178_78420 [Lentzea flava]
MRNQDLPLRAEFRGLPEVPAGQVVTGLIPHEPPNFQTPVALALLSEPVCVLTGQRGVGKTQLAAAHARQRVRDGWLVAWIGAETEDQIRAGMVELADRLGLYRPEDGADITAARVRNHLQTRPGPALLVFDNVVSLDAVRPYLPAVGATQVVITSTVRGSQIKGEVPVEVFDQETALRFLREATGLDDGVAAAELAHEVGYLPLALAQAAARIRSARWGYPKYLENFRKFPAEKQLSRRDGDPYPLGAATAVLMALEPFQDSELVAVLSLLSPEGVSRQVLGDEADDELARLYEASLVDFGGDSSVRMHRLVQRVIRDRSKGTTAELKAFVNAVKLLTHRADFGDGWRHRRLGNELVRQIEALWANTGSTLRLEVFELVLTLRLWAAKFLRDVADLSSAASIAESSYAEGRTRLGEGHQLVIDLRDEIANADGNLPDNDLHLMQAELTTAQKTLGEDHRVTLDTARRLGRRYLDLGRADEGVAVLEQVAELSRRRPRDTGEALDLADDLASAYVAAGRADDACTIIESALQDKLTTLGPVSPSTLHTMMSAVNAYVAAGRYDDAATLCSQLATASSDTLGLDHPLTLMAASMFGVVLRLRGERESSADLLLATSEVVEQLFGEDHKLTVMIRQALGHIRRD